MIKNYCKAFGSTVHECTIYAKSKTRTPHPKAKGTTPPEFHKHIRVRAQSTQLTRKYGKGKESRSNVYHTASLKRTSSKIKAARQEAWKILGDITSMPAWAPGVSEVQITTPHKRGTGATRHVKFFDGRSIEEHITSWNPGFGFTYAAADGLPLRIYIATLAIKDVKDGIRIVWHSYMNSSHMTKPEFAKFTDDMGKFYQESLANLKNILLQKNTRPVRNV